ncbi:MAG TPA: Ig-like domain-containing protein, partial [Candidatus Krumholzibacteria bacterium]|nr:Ig-like domain-containing protein [Candidatus Krumholzibacteria bacterium]
MSLHTAIARAVPTEGDACTAHLSLRPRLTAVVLACCLLVLPGFLQAQPITFTAIGDVPYDESELPILQQHVLNHNLYSPGQFLVHVGDIFPGGTPCEEFRYQQVADVLEQLTVPAFMLPGDNETKDCDDPTQAWSFWTTSFLNLESYFCSQLPVWRQTARPENFAFVSSGVLFIGLHLVGGSNPDALMQDDAAWVEQQLVQQRPFVRAAVLFAQAGPGSGTNLFFDAFVPDAVTFGKPVLFIHGDGHSWIDDNPFGVPGMRRIQVERGDKPPITVTVSTDAVPVFTVNRQPFAGSPVNAAPCVDAGPDLAIGMAQQAWLRGQASDDGDPGSASLSVTWSKVSGPGTVTFTSPSTPQSFASFSLIGDYVLRLRATDGPLVSTDLVSVSVSTTPPANDPPVAFLDSYSTPMQQALTVPAPGVLANDGDPNGTPVSAVLISSTSHGTLSFNANGSFTYTPQSNYYGLDGFSYRASDGSLQSSTTNVTLNITPLTFTLSPLEDATGNSSTPSVPSGSASKLRVEADATSYRSFLKFSVTGTGTTVYRAKLRLFCVNESIDGGSLFRLSNYFPGTTTAWSEGTLTWANAPVIAGTPLGSAGTVRVNQWVEFDITSAIRGDGVYSFALRNASTSSAEYSSKEGVEPPVLVIETRPGGGGANAVPVAVDNGYSVVEDGVLTLAAPGVLGNDSDADGDALGLVLTASTTHGSLSLAATGGFTYTPAANYNGPDSFTYVADDNRGGLEPAVVSLTVTAVNDVPVAGDESYGTSEDVSLVIAAPGVRSNDTDLDGDALTTAMATAPTHGTLVLAANGSFTYTPAADYNGPDSFLYVASDGNGGSDTGAVTLSVSAIEDPPRATDDAYGANEDGNLVVPAPGLLGNDSDPEGDALSATVATPPMHGTLVLAPDGSFTYTPQANTFGPDTFVYTLRDAKGGTDSGSVTLTVAPVNDAPVALADVQATSEDVPLVVPAPGLLGNDTDVDGDVLSATTITPPTHGTLVLATHGGFTYTPQANFSGLDAFTYEVNDGHGGTATAAVSLSVGVVNDAPVTAADSYLTPEDAPLAVTAPGVLGNDADVDGDPLSVTISSPPSHGTVTLAANGGFDYDPAPDFHGADGFTYNVSDGRGGTQTGTATLTVSPVNDAPAASADTHSLDEDQTLVVGVPGLLGNDTDVDGDALTAAVVAPPTHGTLALAADGSFTYTPARDYVGNDSFSYQARDLVTAASATVTLVVRPVNDLPVAAVDTYVVLEDNPLVVGPPGLLDNDTDVDGDDLAAAVVSPPAHGALQLSPSGDFTYTPAADFNGADGFVYSINDGRGGVVSGSVTLSVTAVNDAPVAGDDSYTTLEDAPLTRPLPGVLANDADVDGDALSVLVVTPPTHGTLGLNADGSFTYAPAADFHGADGFTYTVRDPANTTDTGAVAFTVAAVNDAPVADMDGYATAEDVVLTIAAPGVLGNDTDIDGDLLAATLVTPPAHGTLVLNGNGGFSFTPASNFNGNDSFTYTAHDPGGASSSETVLLYVTPRNDAPAAANDAYSTAEDITLTVAAPGVRGNDSDIDGDVLTVGIATSPAHGTLVLAADGSFTYTPSAQYFGADGFTYTLRDPSGATSTGTVALGVTAVNDAPTAANDAYALDEDVVLTMAAPGVRGNDTDIEGD